MKKLALILVTIVCALHGGAQTVTVLSAKGNAPVMFANIQLKPLNTSLKPAVIQSDTSGRATFPTGYLGSKSVITITCLGYDKLTDTIDLIKGIVFYLKAQQHSLNEVVVTGQYAPTTQDNSVHKVRIIDAEKIERMAAVNLRDVLTNEMNIRISQDNILGSGMSLQGISGENVKILIDGVPVIGRQNGNIDLSQVNLDNIERIEIVEGPMSVNYGTNALAGTINLITKKAKKKWEAAVGTYYETSGNYNINARFGLIRNKHSFSISGGRNFFDGWNPGDKIGFFNMGAAKADSSRYSQWKPKEQYFTDLQYGYAFKKVSINYRGSFFQETITNRGLPRAPYGETAFDDYYRTLRIDNAIYVNAKVGKFGNITGLAAFNHYQRVKNTYFKDLTTLAQSETESASDQDTSKSNLFNSRASYSTNNENVKINFEAGYDISVETATGVRITNNKQMIGDYAAFASMEYKPIQQLTFRPGIRYGYNTGYRTPVLPSFNVLYKFQKHFAIRASYARGFRAPSLKELYFYFVDVNHNILGNKDLKAESSHNFNITPSYQWNNDNIAVKAEVSFFYNDITNLITLAQTTGTEYTYINIGRYKTMGTQLTAEVRYKSLTASVGGAYTGTYNDLSESLNVKPFSYSPEVRAAISYEVKKWQLTTSVFYKYTGAMPGYTLDANEQVLQTRMSDYHTADITVAKTLWKRRITIALGSKNLFNVQNINSSAVVAGAVHSTGTGSTPISMGRTYFVKLDFKFQK